MKALGIAILLSLLFVAGRSLHLQIAYTEVEKLTEEHGQNLKAAIDEIFKEPSPVSGLTKTLEYFKVFEYSGTHAKVFVVSRFKGPERMGLPDDRSGVFYYLAFQNGAWIVDPTRPPEFTWSDYGSADGETWPPYR